MRNVAFSIIFHKKAKLNQGYNVHVIVIVSEESTIFKNFDKKDVKNKRYA
jgi:hypothetical protein